MAPTDPATATRPTMLVVDDEPEIRALLSDVLAEQGYAVHAAADGAAALRRV